MLLYEFIQTITSTLPAPGFNIVARSCKMFQAITFNFTHSTFLFILPRVSPPALYVGKVGLWDLLIRLGPILILSSKIPNLCKVGNLTDHAFSHTKLFFYMRFKSTVRLQGHQTNRFIALHFKFQGVPRYSLKRKYMQ